MKYRLFILLIITVFLSACGKEAGGGTPSGEPVNVWENENLKDCMLGFGWHDGKEGTFGYWYEERFAILEELKAVKAYPVSDFTPDKMKYPVYALEMMDTEGFLLPYIWTNGYLITGEGAAYRFDYDFAKLKKTAFVSQTDRKITSVAELPCGFQLVQQDGKWIASRLTEADELSETKEIIFCPEYQDQETIRLILRNEGTQTWIYGEYYSLQVLLDGTWYNVPSMTSSGLLFNDIAYELAPGGSQKISCSLIPFRKLPDGEYRICKSGSMTDTVGTRQNCSVYAEFKLSSVWENTQTVQTNP